jgi:hypothetical protein
MRALTYLVPGLLAIAVLGATDLPPPPSQSPQAQAREEGDEAKERNEARARPARAPADSADAAGKTGDRQDDDDTKSGANKSDDNKADDPGDDEQHEESGKLSLTASQEEAVGIRTDTPRPLAAVAQIEAYATVLDPVALLTDAGRIDSTRATAAATSADAARQASLYRDGAQASLKALQASQAQSIEASAQAQAASMAFRQQWGPLANWSEEQRRALLNALGKGERALLRAEVPGRHLGGDIAREALVEVDGVHLSARVLGSLPRTDVQSQSAGWLLELERAPEGFGPGARATVHLQAAAGHGMLVPAAALVYAQAGVFVYRRVAAETPANFAYEAVAVRPLSRVGDAWLVAGLGHADRIVVQGAGVLWSLQGISSFSAAEEDHD